MEFARYKTDATSCLYQWDKHPYEIPKQTGIQMLSHHGDSSLLDTSNQKLNVR